MPFGTATCFFHQTRPESEKERKLDDELRMVSSDPQYGIPRSHRIFPKAVLKSTYTSREADDIANLAFIGGKTNRQISDKAPVEYFSPLIEKSGTRVFDAQCIPTQPELLDVDTYKSFLIKRRENVSRRLNEFVGNTQPQ